MEPRGHLLAPCAKLNFQGDLVNFDAGLVLERLLLFDNYSIESKSLRELPRLVELFGFGQLCDLLRDQVIRIYPHRGLAVHTYRTSKDLEDGTTSMSTTFNGSEIIVEPGRYMMTLVHIGLNDYSSELQIVREIPGLTDKQRIKLKGLVSATFRSPETSFGNESVLQTRFDLENDDFGLRSLLSRLIAIPLGRSVDPNEIRADYSFSTDTNFTVDHNLTQDFQIDPESAHRYFGNAILSLERFNFRNESAMSINGVVGYAPEDGYFIADKLDKLIAASNPDLQVDRFRRVLQIANFPDLERAFISGAIDVQRLLDLRNRDSSQSFRTWLRGIDNVSDSEISDQISNLRARLAGVIGSPLGKTLSAMTTAAMTFAPASISLIHGALDQFVITKFFDKSGPVAWLGEYGRSITDPGIELEPIAQPPQSIFESFRP